MSFSSLLGFKPKETEPCIVPLSEPSYKDKLMSAVHMPPSVLDAQGYPKACARELFGDTSDFKGVCVSDYYNPDTCHKCWDLPYKEDTL